jgi:phosphoglycolate phosphatase|tara:strand:- start:396 stop:1001 length:606 start_codon:yes stop_codon:yes gene_type:complete
VNLIFDLDGTLIDARLRLYRLFQELVPQSNLTYERYWALKQEKVSNQNLLVTKFAFDSAAIEVFIANWMDRIEAPEFLSLDKNFPGMHQALKKMRKQAKLHVCTARQAKQPVYYQLERLGLLHYFDSIMVTEQNRGKEELVAKVPNLERHDWIIGDTGRDIQVGKMLGLKTCAVLTGFLNEESLRGYEPDLILATASDFRL